MVDDVRQLLGEQPNVEGVQHASGAWCSKVQLKVSCGVPCECRHSTIVRNAELLKHCAHLTSAVCPLRIRGALKASASCSHDGLMTEILFSSIKKMQDTQGHVLHQSWNNGGT